MDVGGAYEISPLVEELLAVDSGWQRDRHLFWSVWPVQVAHVLIHDSTFKHTQITSVGCSGV